EGIPEKDNGDYLSLAGIFAAKGDSEKTSKYLEKVDDDVQFVKTIKSIKAQLAFKSGDYQTALKFLKESGDDSFASKYNIALAAYNAKQEREALSIIQQIIAGVNGPDRADCCRLAGNAAFALKDWKTALGWYLQLSSVDANNSIVQYNLAVASYNLNDIQNSWKYYQRAKALDPSIQNNDIEAKYKRSIGEGDVVAVSDSSEIWYNSAVDLQNGGMDSAAEKLYLKILEKDPAQSLAWNNLGAIYGARGDIDGAEQAYFKAIEKKHDIPETYANLVNLYIELEEYSKARQWIIKGIGHNPDSQVLMELKNKIVEAERNTKKATR
ncbi:MAG: tetratricopeptide repeat protein, partial [Fibrobacter sp.]|nr:tetratricopeptide repeat protein [Fibrobacter sp.]